MWSFALKLVLAMHFNIAYLDQTEIYSIRFVRDPSFTIHDSQVTKTTTTCAVSHFE